MSGASVLEEFSTMTEQGQTTVPSMVRQAPGLDGGDRIAFRVDQSDFAVRRAGDRRDAPAVGAFMTFFARHMQRHPEQLQALTPEFARRIAALAKVDPDMPIERD
jgi:antitoxin PrlF